jgi:branched-chain amino acid transport system permease protein
MNFFLQLVVTGFSLGMVYALISIGFVIILKCSKAFNIAQGHFVLIGGYLAYTFLVSFHLPIWAALLLAMIVASMMGMVIERVALRPLMGQSDLTIIMVTIGLSTILEGLVTIIWGGEYKTYHKLLPTVTMKLGQISIPSESLVGLMVSVLAVVALMYLFHHTKIGLAMRATAEDLRVVQSLGIRATTIYSLSWVIASVVGVVGGILLGSISGVSIALSEVGSKAFAVVLLGGADSIGGAVVAGIILGVLENISAGYLDPLLPGGGFGQIFPYVVMIMVLVFKPHGLFGMQRIDRI